MPYGLYWNQSYLKDERRALAAAWANERKALRAAREYGNRSGDYQPAASSRLRLRAFERRYINIRAIQSGN